MRYQVLEPIKVRTSKGEMELQPGQLITLSPDKAVKLIDRGKILPEDSSLKIPEDLLNTPLKDLKVPLKIWSDLLGETIYLVATEADAHRLMAEGKVAYYPEEVAILLEIKEKLPQDIANERIQRIHQVKKQFGGLITELNWNG